MREAFRYMKTNTQQRAQLVRLHDAALLHPTRPAPTTLEEVVNPTKEHAGKLGTLTKTSSYSKMGAALRTSGELQEEGGKGGTIAEARPCMDCIRHMAVDGSCHWVADLGMSLQWRRRRLRPERPGALQGSRSGP